MPTKEKYDQTNRRRGPCQGCGKRTSAVLCNACRPSKAQRPERVCKTCTRMTTSRDGVCMGCRPTREAKPGKVGPEHALKGGRWVNVGGIARWQQSA